MKDAIRGFLVGIAVVGGFVLWFFTAIGASLLHWMFGDNFVFFVLPVVSCIAAFVMPTTHFLAGYVCFFALGGGIIYGEYLYTTSLHLDTGSPGEAAGLAFLALTAVSVGVGAVLNIVLRKGERMWHAAQQRASDVRKRRR